MTCIILSHIKMARSLRQKCDKIKTISPIELPDTNLMLTLYYMWLTIVSLLVSFYGTKT